MTTPALSPTTYLAQLEADLDRLDGLLAGVRERTWRSPVRGCPGWDVHYLVRHLGGVHRVVIGAVERQERSQAVDHDPGNLPEDDLRTWFHDGSRHMLDLLRTDSQTPAWTFVATDRTIGFWQRRQTQENLLHRLDVETALGCPTPMPTHVAADGIAELVDVLIPWRAAKALALPPYAVRLRATDTGDDWLLGHGNVAGSAAGTAQDLLLTLWKRRQPGKTLAYEGDAEAIRRMFTLPLTP